ncbi:acetyl-CoA carboxylase biotin carboxyl carrier protein subunit [Mameliella sp. AT18]|uniref:acetyl-CoA carboxylase biotin carboxyl carrier protein subunit n=1 Tax=Mameliella sp. AT18 TaxID=3028385 RepID=UPI00237A5780|nr:biotin/lipoyl-containing protein [Mameliella sp. AT18]
MLKSDGTVCLSQEGSETLVLRDLSMEGAQVSARLGKTNAQVEARVRLAERDTGLLISVLTGGVAREFLLPDALSGSAALVDASDSVVAPMTGVIVALDVAVGDTVAEGARLGVMEAMKMETALVAPRIGTVAEVLCAAGDAVEGGAILVNFEAAAS